MNAHHQRVEQQPKTNGGPDRPGPANHWNTNGIVAEHQAGGGLTTRRYPAIARMMPVFKPAPISSLEDQEINFLSYSPPLIARNGMTASAARSSTTGYREGCHQHGQAAPNDSATVPDHQRRNQASVNDHHDEQNRSSARLFRRSGRS